MKIKKDSVEKENLINEGLLKKKLLILNNFKELKKYSVIQENLFEIKSLETSYTLSNLGILNSTN